MAKSPPSFNFYPGDFIMGTVHMSPAAVGCYIRLLSYQWSNGCIPRDKEQMSRICGLPIEGLERLWPELRGKFLPCDDQGVVNLTLSVVNLTLDDFAGDFIAAKEGFFANPRMAEDRPKAVSAWRRRTSGSKQKNTPSHSHARESVSSTTPSTGKGKGRVFINKEERSDPNGGISAPSGDPPVESPPPAGSMEPPTVEEVASHARSRGWAIDAQAFVDYYSSLGWYVGDQPMRSWRAALSAARRWRCNQELQARADQEQRQGSLGAPRRPFVDVDDETMADMRRIRAERQRRLEMACA